MALNISECRDELNALRDLIRTVSATPSPLAMELKLHPKYIETPALRLISDALHEAINKPDGRLILSVPPQEGKTEMVRAAIVKALRDNPDLRVVLGSYNQSLASLGGAAIKNLIEANPDLGLRIAGDTRAKAEWKIDGHAGGLVARGRGSGVAGRAADLLIIDDPFKEGEAQSETIREDAWNWYREGLATRLGAGASAVLIMCMTGDTPVLMGDGTQRPLRDIRPGDVVATYDNGLLATSTVKNWANQGPDKVFRVSMKSGRTVRANARHPFLTIDANGHETWLRTDQIRPGVHILTATGESGVAWTAQSKTAAFQQSAKACATRITAKLAGLLESVRRPPTRHHVAALDSNIGTISRTRRLTSSLLSKVGSALSASSHRPTRTHALTGTASSALTTITSPARFADSSATTATSQSATGNHPTPSALPLTTWNVTPDEVVSIEPCGTEEVFDLQIARTENFIANGLVSHNTRWHADDLVGRLIEQDAHAGWTVVNISAQCDNADGDPLGRQPGEFMTSARGRSREQWEQRKLTAGSQVWNALYQGRPSPAEGGIVKRDWWHRYAVPLWEIHPDGTHWAVGFDELLISADLTFKGTSKSDRVALGVWGRRGASAYLLDCVFGRMEFVPTVRAFANLAAKWPQAVLKLVEDKANGPALMSTLAHRVPGIVPYDPGRIGKLQRLLAVAPLIEAGNIHIPTKTIAPWVDEYVEELAGFPTAAHDDLVDMTSQALDRLLVRPLSVLGDTFAEDDDYDDWRIGY